MYPKAAPPPIVPFGEIALDPTLWWSQRSTNGVRAAVGRYIDGTLAEFEITPHDRVHLVIGSPGSGKTNFLNVWITNLALSYPPSELKFWLWNSKEDMQLFRNLAHTEMYISQNTKIPNDEILDHLESLAEYRYKQFQLPNNFDEYRKSNQPPLPRIMVVIDGFDSNTGDRLNLTSLSRLIRFTRALGFHFIVSIQSISYIRAARIVTEASGGMFFNCTEREIYFLSKQIDTDTQRSPGEAIYHNYFDTRNVRVAWLPHSQQEIYVEKIMQLAQSSKDV